MGRRLKGCGVGQARDSSRLGECAAWGRRDTLGRSGRGSEGEVVKRSVRARGSTRVPLDVAFRRRLFRFTLVRLHLSQNLSTKVHKVMNRKVVDLTTLYNYYKGRMVFFSTDFAQITAKL
jgi:hypothetical protein